ncbi:MAG: GntP family permease, partial [Brevibacterium yomogidense]
GDVMVLVHTGIAIALIVLLIMGARLNAVIALLAGSIYLGLAAGLGFTGTTEALATGFGDIMAEVGLIIAMGVLLGSLLASMGTLENIVDRLLALFTPKQLPYAAGLTLTVFFPVIYGDVLLVLMAPIVRSLAPRLGPGGMAKMCTALAVGINVGLVFVVPGAAAIAIAGLLGVQLGTMLFAGLLLALPTAVLTMLVYNQLLRFGLWNPEKDELAGLGDAEAETSADDAGPAQGSASVATRAPLRISLLPIVVAVLLVAAGVVADMVGAGEGVVGFLGNPVIAISIALVLAYLLAWRTLGRQQADDAIGTGFRESGIVLIITGAGGSLAAVIGQTGMEDILGGYFSAGAFAPLLIAWGVAAILQIALGSATVAIITAGGILAPIMSTLDVPTVLVALVASSGALFGMQLNSNFFWIFQPLLRLTTLGTLKTLTLPMCIASVISLALIMLASLVV